jgi:hypothetical protein
LRRLFSCIGTRFWNRRPKCLLRTQFLRMICVDLLPTGCWR